MELGGQVYVFSGDRYGRLGAAQELDSLVELKPIEGNWGNLPYRFRAGLDGAGATADALYLFRGERYVRYPADRRRPASGSCCRTRLRSAQYEIIRLTTGTAVTLNRRLLAGGVGAVLATSTQETDETPAFDTRRSRSTVIQVRPDRVDEAHLPVSSHLDFDSANGVYYWEAFFHAPLLIAKRSTRPSGSRRRSSWYEYIFDPTQAGTLWRFLPFRAVDVDALLDTVPRRVRRARRRGRRPAPSQRLPGLLDRVRVLARCSRRNARSGDDEEDVLDSALPQLVRDLTDYVAAASRALAGRAGLHGTQGALRSLSEASWIIGGLKRRYDLMLGGLAAAVRRYLDDPFDPHAIAAMRPGAYRRAVVMAYIDNLLDWGDMLFRQYTGESIDEARMLYVLAFDLLGRAARAGSVRGRCATREYFGQLEHELGEYDVLLRWAASRCAVHASAAPAGDDAYFFVPENTQLSDYWTRVEDRLHKIRQSQDILGVSRPLPLFEPPIDPSALVRGGRVRCRTSRRRRRSRHRWRSRTTGSRSCCAGPRSWCDRLQPARQRPARRAGAARRRGARACCRAGTRARSSRLTRAIKEDQVAAARGEPGRAGRERDGGPQPADALPAAAGPGAEPARAGADRAHDLGGGRAPGRRRAQARVRHRARLPAVSHRPVHRGYRRGRRRGRLLARQVLRVLLIARRGPEHHRRGPRHLREPPADGGGLAAAAEHGDERPGADRSSRRAAATRQLAIAERDLEIVQQQIAQNESVTTFLHGQVRQCPALRLDVRAAVRALPAGLSAWPTTWRRAPSGRSSSSGPSATARSRFIRPVYWDSRRNGLLAGETLGLDLQRHGQRPT